MGCAGGGGSLGGAGSEGKSGVVRRAVAEEVGWEGLRGWSMILADFWVLVDRV